MGNYLCPICKTYHDTTGCPTPQQVFTTHTTNHCPTCEKYEGPVEAAEEWAKAREATNKCTELLLSSPLSEEPQKIMMRFRKAADSLKAALDALKEGE